MSESESESAAEQPQRGVPISRHPAVWISGGAVAVLIFGICAVAAWRAYLVLPKLPPISHCRPDARLVYDAAQSFREVRGRWPVDLAETVSFLQSEAVPEDVRQKAQYLFPDNWQDPPKWLDPPPLDPWRYELTPDGPIVSYFDVRYPPPPYEGTLWGFLYWGDLPQIAIFSMLLALAGGILPAWITGIAISYDRRIGAVHVISAVITGAVMLFIAHVVAGFVMILHLPSYH